jgi:hypothetical protein
MVFNVMNFYFKTFTQRRKAAKVPQRKAKGKELCGNFASLRLCVEFLTIAWRH